MVGCGASGALLAIELLRQSRGLPLELTVVEPRGELARGVAYSTPDPLHLLNVPACSMSAIESEPDHLVRWARERGLGGAADFLPRREFGEYLAATLAERLSSPPPGTAVRMLADRVVAVEPQPSPDAPLRAELAGGGTLDADHAVLALGSGPIRDPSSVSAELRASPHYVADPWAGDPRRIAAPGESVLLIGTGLTMVDVALSLHAGGEGPRLLAVSRAGLVPRGHRPGQPLSSSGFPLPRGQIDLPALLHAFFAQLTLAANAGGDETDVVDSMREASQRVWIALSESERRWFLTHLRRRWEVTRHRMAPEVAARVAELRRGGALRIERAGVESLRLDEGGAIAALRRGELVEEARFDRIVNCAGPEDDATRFGQPLLDRLLAGGSALPDPLRLGLATEPGGALLGSAGPSTHLHAIGPLRKGALWETTAVPEIRRQAVGLAALLLDAEPAKPTALPAWDASHG